MITDWKQAWLAKMTGRRLQEESGTGFLYHLPTFSSSSPGLPPLLIPKTPPW